MRNAWHYTGLGLALLFTLSLTGCTCLHVDRLSCPGSADCHFPGLAPAPGDDRKTALLLVHGMGSPEEGWSGPLVAGLTQETGFTRTPDPSVRREIRKPGRTFLYGALNTTFYRSAAGRRLEVHELTWSPTTKVVKDALLGFDTVPELIRDRVVINRSLKKELIDERLADPVLYVGTYKPQMQYPVQQAICWILKGDSATAPCTFEGIDPAGIRGTRIDLITFSLGSRMVFDTLAGLLDSPKDAETHRALETLVLNIESVYMLANQLPLLELGNVTHAPGEPAAAEELEEAPHGLDRVLQLRTELAPPSGPEEAGAAAAPIWLIAFSDPNDLLSYTIPAPFAGQHPDHRFANVSISVATRALLGKLANPLTAHTGHDRVPKIIFLIAHGGGNGPESVH